MNVPLKPLRSVLAAKAAMPDDSRTGDDIPCHDLPCHEARSLTGQGGRAVIVLDGQTYFLRITRAGKLILTK